MSAILAACLVVAIADGDTLTVHCNKHEQIKIRLAEIDAPEKKQPFGMRSKQSLSQLCYRSEDLAECARLLALNVAHYQSKFGELPLDETLAMIGMTKPNEAQIQLMADGMEVLVGVLGNVVSGTGQPRH
jgi:hypothetical protein